MEKVKIHIIILCYKTFAFTLYDSMLYSVNSFCCSRDADFSNTNGSRNGSKGKNPFLGNN